VQHKWIDESRWHGNRSADDSQQHKLNARFYGGYHWEPLW